MNLSGSGSRACESTNESIRIPVLVTFEPGEPRTIQVVACECEPVRILIPVLKDKIRQ